MGIKIDNLPFPKEDFDSVDHIFRIFPNRWDPIVSFLFIKGFGINGRDEGKIT